MKPIPAKVSEPRPALSGFFIGLAASCLLAAGFAAAWLTFKGPLRPRAAAPTTEPAAATTTGSTHEKYRWVPPRFTSGAPETTPHKPKPMRNRAALDGESQSWSPNPSSPYITEGTPRTAQSLAQEQALRKMLEGLRAGHPGVAIRFANCQGETCVGQVQSMEAAAIDKFAADARRLAPGYQVQVRERLTAFNGRLWEADLVAPSGERTVTQ
jgi:hypothetical protein